MKSNKIASSVPFTLRKLNSVSDSSSEVTEGTARSSHGINK